MRVQPPQAVSEFSFHPIGVDGARHKARSGELASTLQYPQSAEPNAIKRGEAAIERCGAGAERLSIGVSELNCGYAPTTALNGHYRIWLFDAQVVGVEYNR